MSTDSFRSLPDSSRSIAHHIEGIASVKSAVTARNVVHQQRSILDEYHALSHCAFLPADVHTHRLWIAFIC